jgi:hypothetical protein
MNKYKKLETREYTKTWATEAEKTTSNKPCTQNMSVKTIPNGTVISYDHLVYYLIF